MLCIECLWKPFRQRYTVVRNVKIRHRRLVKERPSPIELLISEKPEEMSYIQHQGFCLDFFWQLISTGVGGFWVYLDFDLSFFSEFGLSFEFFHKNALGFIWLYPDWESNGSDFDFSSESEYKKLIWLYLLKVQVIEKVWIFDICCLLLDFNVWHWIVELRQKLRC